MAESVISQGTGGATVDPDHPWLGLHPFTEENQHYFFGRTAEIREIFLRVRENPLTVLYGNSGLGKTSLVRAGLIPKLRVERFRPVHLLLDFSSASPSLTDQVREALAKVCADPDSDAATLLERWAPLGSLWEIYAHEKLRPPEIAARPPVLIFDQFEEVFTLGRDEAGTANRRNAEVTELFTQIADLVENRAPAKLQALFRDEPQRALDYDFGTTVARVVLALREDFLAQFEQWKSVMPSLMRNRMPLRLLTGPQALEAVVRPGRMDGLSLVSDQVGEQIVRFVAQRPDDTPLEQIEAVPPLVSLVCERLNAARLAAEPPQKEISDELVKSQGADILQRFYDESFAAFRDGEREAVREYIEERMVTVGGHRNPVAREDAVAELARRGISAPDSVLDALIARRLLTPEQRGGIQRLEITHDVLAPLVVRGRKEREERHLTREAERRTEEAKRKQAEAEALAATERRHRRWLGIALGFVSALLLLAVGALWFAVQQKQRADEAAARAEEQSALARQERTRADQAAREATIAAARAEEKSKEALKEKQLADEATKAAEKSASRLQEQLARAQIEEGRAWIERAKLNSARGNNFAAVLMAARALGFAGYGREKIVDPKFNEEFPVLLTRTNDPIDEQEARRRINEAALSAGYFGLPLWQSPVFRQDDDLVSSVAWSPDGKTLASGSDDHTVKLWEVATAKLLSTLEGHAGSVLSVAWSPDGKTLASGSGDNTVKLWDTATGKLLSTLKGHTDVVESVAWSPDGKTLASGSGDHTVKLWEAATGKLLSTLEGQTDPVWSVAWSPDGKTLASGSGDHTVKLWEAATGKLLSTLEGHTDLVRSVAWSPDGKTLASGSGDHTVKLWDAATGKLLSTLKGHADLVRSVAWSPDGKTLASGSGDQTVELWDTATGKLLSTLKGHTDVVESVAWSLDGKTLASGSRDHTVKLWEAATGKLLSTLEGHTNWVLSVAWSPDGKTLASGSFDKTVKLWEVATGKLVTTFQGHTGAVRSVAWSPDGKTLASGSDDQTVKLWEVATGKLVTTFQGHTAVVESVAWSPDGRSLASGSGDQTVKLWEAATGKLLSTLKLHTDSVWSVAWSPDGKTLASGSGDHTVELWETATGKPLSNLQWHTHAVYSVAWSPDGKTLASGSGDNTVKLWDTASGKLLSTLEGHTNTVASVAWSADGKTLASGSFDKTVKLWEAATGKLLATLEGHTGTVWSVAWSPDGKTLASGSFDKTVKLWEAATGKLLATLEGHTGEVTGVAWSPDGKTLASGSFDKTVKLWEAATGKLVTTFQGHTGTVWSVAWSPNGKTLASGSRDNTVKLWEVATAKPLSTLQGHTGELWSVAWSPDGKTLASGSRDKTVKLWEAPSTFEIDLAEYLRSRWIRFAGSEVAWESNDNLLRDRSFDVVNLRGTTLLGIERSGSVGSQKLTEELSLLLRAGNFPEAIAIWKATSTEAAVLPIRRMLLAALSASAADDLFLKTRWRGLWLTEQMQSMITAEAMLDPAVSLGMLRLDTQLAPK